MPLVTTANVITTTSDDNVYAGTAGADTYIFDNTSGTGQDTINFGKNDSLLMAAALYDGDGDGIIKFGSDKRLDTYDGADGLDEINLVGVNFNSGVRYLGTDGTYFAYATAATKLGYAATKTATEGTIGNDTFDAGGGNVTYFYDTALGLNLGADTITNFGDGDKIITTSALRDGNSDMIIHQSGDGLLQLPGADGNDARNGGTINFGDAFLRLELTGSETVGGVTYFTYELFSPTTPV